MAGAVGQIVGGHEYHDPFNGVDGWDIAHVRRVRWLCSDVKNFDTYTFKQSDTTQPLSERNPSK